jgi:hypothetical protein
MSLGLSSAADPEIENSGCGSSIAGPRNHSIRGLRRGRHRAAPSFTQESPRYPLRRRKIRVRLLGLAVPGRTSIATLTRPQSAAGGQIPRRQARRRRTEPIDWRHQAIIFWGRGLRGALPLVMALSLPPAFELRPLILDLTAGVVLFTCWSKGQPSAA